MILVAESGSTKTDWLYFNTNDDNVTKYTTVGFNPFFWKSDDVYSELIKDNTFKNISEEVRAVHFFGSGCSSDERCRVIQRPLEKIFSNAKVIVEHDMLSACYATCARDEGIVGILGTGSNSCYFNGIKAIEELPALGYILGDEAGGTYFGKQILKDFCYKQLPDSMCKYLKETKGLDKEIVLNSIYRNGHDNVYIASFASILKEFSTESYVDELLERGFQEFIDVHLFCFHNVKSIPVHFVGSIAWHYREKLQSVLKEKGLIQGKIIEKPSEDLMAFLKNEFQQTRA